MAEVKEEAVGKSTNWLPDPTQVIRENGDSVVELRQNGDLVGEINFTKIVGGILERFGFKVQRVPPLKVVE